MFTERGLFISCTILILITAVRIPAQDFRFDSTISREVLENYLDRSISYTELLHDDLSEERNRRGVDPRDNIRMLLNCRAKFIGRAIMLWGRESNLETFLANAEVFADTLHREDPEIILQAAEFEIVTTDIESVPIPAHVFENFDLPVESRNFDYEAMIYEDGTFVNHWGNGRSVPDMSRTETRMWFYFLAAEYMDIGIEAIHFGQVGLMANNDRDYRHWLDMLTRVRAYAKRHARRHMVLCDAHTHPSFTYRVNDTLLFDLHSFPMRIAEVENEPVVGELREGYNDALYNKSKGGIAPSGWSCTHLPWLAEFDNFGAGNPGLPSGEPYIWGWDEITWFAVMPEEERNQWLRYAWNWIKGNDTACHLQMPGSRVLTRGPEESPNWYWANTRSDACPLGFNTEETIKDIWGAVETGIDRPPITITTGTGGRRTGRVALVSLSGKIIRTFTSRTDLTVGNSRLPQGLYIVKAGGSEATISKSMIIGW